MKQVININFHGQVVPIEVSAFELLKQYTESLSRYFAEEEGKDEIINDIESRFAELFQERLKKGATCITDEDVNAIIKSMGRPEEFETETGNASASQPQPSPSASDSSQTRQGATHKRLYRNENEKIIGGVCSGLANYFNIDPVVVRIIFVVFGFAFFGFFAYLVLWLAVPSSASEDIGSSRKKLYRAPDEKIIGGVCSGIGNYFGINPWVPRVLFLLPFLSFAFHLGHWGFFDFPNFVSFSFSPGALILYIILWMVIPEASTTAEKLEMKGEKVDLTSIKNSVMEEIKVVSQKAEKFGEEAKTAVQEKGKMMSREIGGAAKRGRRSLGDIILFIIKAFAYFVFGCIAFAFVAALFAFAIAALSVFPLKEYLLKDGWQTILAWGTLILFVAVPVVGVITWIVRRLARAKANRKILRFSFLSLWFIGLICFVTMIAMVARDFKRENDMTPHNVILTNPMVEKLEITAPDDLVSKNYRNRWLKFAPFMNITDEDTVFVNNVHFRIIKSPNDSFQLSIIKLANGNTKQEAEILASSIEFNPVQKDSFLQMPVGIPINTKQKFRNQHVVLTVAVPVGKRIKINQSVWENNIERVSIGFDGSDDWDGYWGGEERGWTTDQEYIMKADGLYTLSGKPAKNSHEDWEENREDREDKNRIDNYRYDNQLPADKSDTIKQKTDLPPVIKDSTEKPKPQVEKKEEKTVYISNIHENISGYRFQIDSPLADI